MVVDEYDGTREADIAPFADLQPDRRQREREDLRRGLGAAVDAIYGWTRPKEHVLVAIVATYDDPTVSIDEQTDPGQSVPVGARFISLAEAKPLTDDQRQHVALETVRAASEHLFDEYHRGLRLTNLIDELATAAEKGDIEAATRYFTIVEAIGHAPNPIAGETN